MSDSEKTPNPIDVTSPQARKTLIELLKLDKAALFEAMKNEKNPFKQALLMYGVMLTAPISLAGAFVESVASLTSDSVEAREREIEAQKQAAVDIIKAGKENDVDELEIQISQKAGLALGTNIEGAVIESVIGSSGTMILKVKYKQ